MRNFSDVITSGNGKYADFLTCNCLCANYGAFMPNRFSGVRLQCQSIRTTISRCTCDRRWSHFGAGAPRLERCVWYCGSSQSGGCSLDPKWCYEPFIRTYLIPTRAIISHKYTHEHILRLWLLRMSYCGTYVRFTTRLSHRSTAVTAYVEDVEELNDTVNVKNNLYADDTQCSHLWVSAKFSVINRTYKVVCWNPILMLSEATPAEPWQHQVDLVWIKRELEMRLFLNSNFNQWLSNHRSSSEISESGWMVNEYTYPGWLQYVSTTFSGNTTSSRNY